jgi:hypothetical protein
MKILVDGFFRSGSHYIYYAFKNSYPNDEIFYGYPMPHYGIDEDVKDQFNNIAITIRNPYDVLVSCIHEFTLINDDEKTNFYINNLKGYFTGILQEKNNVYIMKFDDMVTDLGSCMQGFANRFPECVNFIVPNVDEIKNQMSIEAPSNALPFEDGNIRDDAKAYLNQDKFAVKLAELNNLYDQIVG